MFLKMALKPGLDQVRYCIPFELLQSETLFLRPLFSQEYLRPRSHFTSCHNAIPCRYQGFFSVMVSMIFELFNIKHVLDTSKR